MKTYIPKFILGGIFALAFSSHVCAANTICPNPLPNEFYTVPYDSKGTTDIMRLERIYANTYKATRYRKLSNGKYQLNTNYCIDRDINKCFVRAFSDGRDSWYMDTYTFVYDDKKNQCRINMMSSTTGLSLGKQVVFDTDHSFTIRWSEIDEFHRPVATLVEIEPLH